MANIDKIKQLAKEKGIKIKFICGQLGLSETYLSNVKNGRDHMTDERLSTIAKLLGTTTAYLNDETDEKRPLTDFTPNSVTVWDKNGIAVSRTLSPEQTEILISLLEQFK